MPLEPLLAHKSAPSQVSPARSPAPARIDALGRLGLAAASALSTWLGSTAVQALEPLDRSSAAGADVCPFASCSEGARTALISPSESAGLAAIFRCSGR